jgi:hypothetical protein
VVTRVVEVSPARLTGWVERYAATHAAITALAVDGGVRLETATGASAELMPLTAYQPDTDLDDDALLTGLAGHAATSLTVGLVLVRRGGYAMGVAVDGRLLASKVGTRYVQSRTAAGGWSQQRFARRRDGQARDLLAAAAEAWRGLDQAARQGVSVLVTGGDRAMCERLLADPRLPSLPASRHLGLPDPRQAVLVEAAERVRALVVTIREP